MTGLEIARKVVSEGLHCFRVRSGQELVQPGPGAKGLKHWAQPRPLEYDCRPWPGGKKKGWVLLDHFTASAIVAWPMPWRNQGIRETGKCLNGSQFRLWRSVHLD